MIDGFNSNAVGGMDKRVALNGLVLVEGIIFSVVLFFSTITEFFILTDYQDVSRHLSAHSELRDMGNLVIIMDEMVNSPKNEINLVSPLEYSSLHHHVRWFREAQLAIDRRSLH